ncbi:hypothetical protein [Aquimarina sp. 2304DJ70-9]|uniref:hypothetical protein n=1 Tax=Aquimarina penaris TaxID=3231044 RepID=UPI003462B3EF
MHINEIEDVIFKIEKENEVALGNYKEWALIRNRLYMNLLKPLDLGIKTKKERILSTFFFQNLFYGLRKWFKRYDVLVFTHNENRRLVEEKYFDRVLDGLIDKAERKSTLFITLTDKSFIKQKELYSANVVSQLILDIFAYILFIVSPKRTNRGTEIQEIVKKYGITIDQQKELRLFKAYYRFYKLFLKVYRPKKIFVSTYYSATRNYMIKAANDLGIPTIEGQHGYIGNAHPSYNCDIALDTSYIPSQLWVFSEFDKNVLERRGVYTQDQIKVKGNAYLDYIKSEGKKQKPEIIERIAKYKKVVGVSLQIPMEGQLIPFVIEAANLDPSILYILIPRKWNERYEEIDLPANVVFSKKNGFYDVVVWCTHHSTVFSSTAFEANYFGIPNILIDIDGLATRYFGVFFEKQNIVNDKREFINLILPHNKS